MKTFEEYIKGSGYNLHERTIMESAWDAAMKECTPNAQQAHTAIADMDKAVKCLALELPESVWEDVNKRWNAVKMQQW